MFSRGMWAVFSDNGSVSSRSRCPSLKNQTWIPAFAGMTMQGMTRE